MNVAGEPALRCRANALDLDGDGQLAAGDLGDRVVGAGVDDPSNRR